MHCRMRCVLWRLGPRANMPWLGIGEGEEQTLLPKSDRSDGNRKANTIQLRILDYRVGMVRV